MEGDNCAHVFLVPFPAQGHITPLLQFGMRLTALGVRVTLVLTKHLYQTAIYSSQNFIDVATISDGYDGGFNRTWHSFEQYYESFKRTGHKEFSELISNSMESPHPATTVIYDSQIPWVKDVARKFNLVAAAFLTQSCSVNWVYYHVQRGYLPLPLTGDSISLPGLPSLEVSNVPSFVSSAGFCDYPVFRKIVLQQFDDFDDADWVLSSAFDELEPEIADWMRERWRFATVGPTIPSMYLDRRIVDDQHYGLNLFVPDTETCRSWLASKPVGSVAYISLGSVARVGEEQMEELGLGLKQSGCYFVWVVRQSEEAKLPNNYKENVSEKGLVVNWCSQLEVLAHQSVGCFVTHCGFNSVLEGLTLGVPMVALPLWSDQPTNAKYVSDVWKVGVRPTPGGNGLVGREALAECVKEIIEGELGKEMAANARRWRELARKAAREGGSSDRSIKEFVAGVRRHRLDESPSRNKNILSVTQQ